VDAFDDLGSPFLNITLLDKIGKSHDFLFFMAKRNVNVKEKEKKRKATKVNVMPSARLMPLNKSRKFWEEPFSILGML
jgi:hypothetical protein